MKFFLFSRIILIILSCSVKKANEFTLLYDGKYTGLDTLIIIDGYYYNSITNSIVLFYRDGLFISGNFSFDVDQATIFNLFEKNTRWAQKMSKESKTLYGRYVASQNMILTQKVCYDFYEKSWVQERTFNIISNKLLFCLEDNAYYSFYPTVNRMDSTNQLLKEKWFWTKEA